MFSGTSNEDILGESIQNDQNDEKGTADCSLNKKVSPEDAISLINSLQDFVAIAPNVSYMHLNSLNGLKYISMQMPFA